MEIRVVEMETQRRGERISKLLGPRSSYKPRYYILINQKD